MDFETSVVDSKTCDAVIRNREVIGETSNNIAKNHPEFAILHASVPRSFNYEMRNALSHGYFTADFAIVWQTIHNDLPSLHEKIAALLDQAATVF